MPTGYTADVQSGKITEFADFAMHCARAFGALVTMRDEPASANIPEKFEPSTSYHDKAIESANATLGMLANINDADLADYIKALNEDIKKDNKHRATENAAQMARYHAMLDRVREWNPPTSDHTGLKDFMESQLTESLGFDGRCYQDDLHPTDPEEYRRREREKAEHDISYHKQKIAEEIDRVQKRNDWLATLRKSLEPHSKAA